MPLLGAGFTVGFTLFEILARLYFTSIVFMFSYTILALLELQVEAVLKACATAPPSAQNSSKQRLPTETQASK